MTGLAVIAVASVIVVLVLGAVERLPCAGADGLVVVDVFVAFAGADIVEAAGTVVRAA